MFPQKRKRVAKRHHHNLRWLLVAIIGLPLPAIILINQSIAVAQFVDMLLIGVMLCCGVYLLYQGFAAILTIGLETEDENSIEQS